MTRIAILAAQTEEIAPLLARLAARRAGGDRRAVLWRALDRGVEITFAVGGAGRRRADAATTALLEASGASRLLVIGVAGALTGDLSLAEVVVAAEVWTERGERLSLDAQGLETVRAAGARRAVVVTVDRMVVTVADREALLGALPARSAALGGGGEERHPIERQQTGTVAPPHAVVVDMESYDAAARAAALGIPSIVLRAVSDAAGEDLPAFLERCRRADGDVDRRRVVAHALAHPRAIPALLELRRRVRLGAEALADVVVRILPAL